MDNVEEEDPVWRRVDDELQRRASNGEFPASWQELGRAVGLESDKRQMAGNWKLRRRLPPSWHAKVADALGWKLDRLLKPESIDDTAGSPDAPPQPQIYNGHTSLTREQFLAHCANLSTPDWQLTARLMVAAGILPGLVEVTQQWDLKEPGSGQAEKRPMTVEETLEERARRGRL